MFEEYVAPVTEFVRAHQAWAAPIVGALAFAESIAFLSLFVPAWGVLVAVGALIGAGVLPFWSIWIAGAVGAALGDWISYSIGYHFKDRVHHMWPLNKHPQMLEKGEKFFHGWGALGVVVGRFFGPLRATVPLFAGIFEMPWLLFQLANFSSAFLWAAVLLAPGAFGVDAFSRAKAALGF
jgi:membrane protein DedA with SNARE-associated domain